MPSMSSFGTSASLQGGAGVAVAGVRSGRMSSPPVSSIPAAAPAASNPALGHSHSHSGRPTIPVLGRVNPLVDGSPKPSVVREESSEDDDEDDSGSGDEGRRGAIKYFARSVRDFAEDVKEGWDELVRYRPDIQTAYVKKQIPTATRGAALAHAPAPSAVHHQQQLHHQQGQHHQQQLKVMEQQQQLQQQEYEEYQLQMQRQYEEQMAVQNQLQQQQQRQTEQYQLHQQQLHLTSQLEMHLSACGHAPPTGQPFGSSAKWPMGLRRLPGARPVRRCAAHVVISGGALGFDALDASAHIGRVVTAAGGPRLVLDAAAAAFGMPDPLLASWGATASGFLPPPTTDHYGGGFPGGYV
eukprot:CAMPEP_0177285768 /NCGR_PEP_ID=MMETSP0367-20130122/73240_1 /TAXON_ID=447022 ORGANISM="Scrippsiella hangoei-like, Strain SHHI-4" /NCGR_SAMPLE_ID=MMETSP0367 /ASSEMBLY_ACC=CAM_ASM_000362 /LENGTH=353 /DNA_ID=CAMNT_0018742919 /DNA_START=60 /DNA_END=1118 /DNA_ORIENTATION=+